MATHKPINILEAFAAAPPPLDYVLPNMVAGTVGALVSPGGAGKSMLALQLAAQIAGGPDLLEVGELPTGPVIYLPAEDPPTAIHHRLHALGAHLSAEERQAVADGLLIQPLIGSLPNIMAPEWFDGLKRAAEGRIAHVSLEFSAVSEAVGFVAFAGNVGPEIDARMELLINRCAVGNRFGEREVSAASHGLDAERGKC